MKNIFRRLIKESGQGLFFGGYKKQGMGELHTATSPSVSVNPFSIGPMPDLRAGVIAMHWSQGALLGPLETENN